MPEKSSSLTTTIEGVASPNIHRRLLNVQKRVEVLQKEGHNEYQGYDYLKESSVVIGTREALIAEGVLVVTDVDHYGPADAYGNVYINAIYEFVNVDNPQDRITVRIPGSGRDLTKSGPGDKALPKAITMSKKYALMLALLLATGDDAERAREDEKPGAEILPNRAAAPAKAPPLGATSIPVAAPPPNGKAVDENADMQVKQAAGMIAGAHQRAASMKQELERKAAGLDPLPLDVDLSLDDEDAQWVKDMTRFAEDATSAEVVAEHWLNNMNHIRTLAMNDKPTYNELHQLYIVRKAKLEARAMEANR
jgi:hypothetical protein